MLYHWIPLDLYSTFVRELGAIARQTNGRVENLVGDQPFGGQLAPVGFGLDQPPLNRATSCFDP